MNDVQCVFCIFSADIKDILLTKLNETFPELHQLRDKKENIKAEFLHRKDNITAKFNATKGNLVGKSNLIQISI